MSLTRSPPSRSVDDQEGLILNSYDRTLVVKQISSEDVADMHGILSEYHQVRSLVTLYVVLMAAFRPALKEEEPVSLVLLHVGLQICVEQILHRVCVSHFRLQMSPSELLAALSRERNVRPVVSAYTELRGR